MARLSSPESAIRKIEGVQEQLETLYGAVDRITELRDRLAETVSAAAGHESGLRERLETLGALEAEYRAAVDRLSELGDRADQEIDRVRAALEWERDALRRTRADFQADRDRQQSQRMALEREVAAAARETVAGVAHLEARVDETLREAALEMARERDALHAAAEAEMAPLRETARRVEEEAFHLEDRLEAFKSDVAGRMDRRVALLAERQRSFRETALQELHQRFTETSSALESRIEAAAAEIRKAGEGERARVSEAVDFLESERRAAAERAETEATAAARRQTEAEGVIADTRERADQAIADLNAVMAREVDHVAAFIADAEGQVQGLKGELKGFRDRVAAAVTRRADALRKEQSDFQKSLRQELEGRISDRLRTLEDAVDEQRATLSGDRQSLDEMHQVLEEALAQVNRRIKERTTFFSTQLNNLIVGAQRDLSQASDAARGRVDERLERLDAFGDEQRASLKKLRDQLRNFAGTLKERLEADRRDRETAWETFRTEMTERVDQRIARETARQADALRADLERRLDAAAEARRTEAAEATRRAEAVEGRMAALEKAQAEAESALRQRMSGVKKTVQRLVDRQETADRAAAERLAALEAALQSRKGRFSFPGRKREEAE
jgi:chromosome segregation ATPase